ncbi:FMN-binding protein [Pseudarthrobacter enclensis]|uniref:FMN-binding protein n=1 Tax=Pseudarthrobacter enclensis TaxID=993070 RepID=UPI00369CE9E5
MKARGTLAAALASAGILLAGWQAGTQAGGVSMLASGTTSSGTTGSGPTAAGATGASGTGASGTGSSGTGSSGTGSSGSTSTAAGTYKGTAVQTRFGAVQVQITVASGKITDVTALQLTDDDRKSVQISNRAAPLLRSEVLSAQSADVQTISGATVTSNAYLTSLQAAIDAANL